MPIFSRFGADFFTVYADFSRFIRDINGEKKTSRYWWSFSRLVFHGLPPLDCWVRLFQNILVGRRAKFLCQGCSSLASSNRSMARLSQGWKWQNKFFTNWVFRATWVLKTAQNKQLLQEHFWQNPPRLVLLHFKNPRETLLWKDDPDVWLKAGQI